MAFTPRRLMRGASGGAADPDSTYQISRSLRFNSADTAYLNRTPASVGNRQIWTWSGWVKLGRLDKYQTLIEVATADAGNRTAIHIDGGNQRLRFFCNNTSAADVYTSQVFRDSSAWYHIVCAVDTTQATSSNRVKIYINGVQVTAFGTASYPSQNFNTQINTTELHTIAKSYDPTYSDFYLTEINFIDGQALTPSSFGETNARTGVWGPKAYSGSYGTNGFYLNFSDNSNTTAATLGKDYSGNGNNWTPNNFSVTAGAGNDSLVDSPTSYGTDTGVGGTVRGNYCTFSAVDKATTVTLSNGGLDLIGTNSGGRARASMAVSSGKWYFEFLMNDVNNGGYNGFMATTARADVTGGGGTTDLGQNVDTWGIPNFNGGTARNNGSNGASITGITNGQIGMFALDMDTGKFWYGINGTWVNSGDPVTGANPVYSNLSGYTVAAAIGHGTSTYISYSYNFGQRAFSYTAPTGFKALCTRNLPVSTIGATTATQAGKYFNTVLYTGNGATQTISGVGFQPDFVWAKSRSDAYYHTLLDVVRGRAKMLFTNGTFAEYTDSPSDKELTAFTSDGFSLGPDLNYSINSSAKTFVAWNWKAGSSTVTNTSGSISSQVSANPTAGFSVVTYTGNSAADQTVGHGLGVAPSMIIVKSRGNTDPWVTYHSVLGPTKFLYLNTTDGVSTVAGYWGTPSSTTFGIKGGGWANNPSTTVVAYCFAEVAGYSKFGSYTGNGSSSGPFVFTNMQVAYVMIKCTDTAGTDWAIYDNKRNTYNVVNTTLEANLTLADYTSTNLLGIDFLSNGFRLIGTDNGVNGSGKNYIFMAFSQNPFKYSLAR